jgi:hypothetical protein
LSDKKNSKCKQKKEDPGNNRIIQYVNLSSISDKSVQESSNNNYNLDKPNSKKLTSFPTSSIIPIEDVFTINSIHSDESSELSEYGDWPNEAIPCEMNPTRLKIAAMNTVLEIDNQIANIEKEVFGPKLQDKPEINIVQKKKHYNYKPCTLAEYRQEKLFSEGAFSEIAPKLKPGNSFTLP